MQGLLISKSGEVAVAQAGEVTGEEPVLKVVGGVDVAQAGKGVIGVDAKDVNPWVMTITCYSF